MALRAFLKVFLHIDIYEYALINKIAQNVSGEVRSISKIFFLEFLHVSEAHLGIFVAENAF
jgi:hypothetical protein